MAIQIAAIVTMDDADAVDCQHGEDEALEATKRSIAVVQDATAKPTTEVMTIEITAVITMDDADAVDCQHGEDESFEATKRSSAVTKEHGSEAALVPDRFVPGNPYNLWISIGLNGKNMETFEPQSSIISLASVKLAKTDVSGAKIHVDSLHVPNLQD
jgi:hypothetical protein